MPEPTEGTLTRETVEEIVRQAVGGAVKEAVGAASKQLLKDSQAQQEAFAQSILKAIGDEPAAETTEPESAAAGEAPKAADAPKPDPKLASELRQLRRQLEVERSEREKLTDALKDKEKRAEETDRYSRIRTLLAESKVTKVDLAFKALKDDIYRGEDGELYAKMKGEDVPASELVAGFLKDNPEFLPPRIAGGSGATGNRSSGAPEVQLEDIKPGADPKVLEAARKKVAEVLGAMRSGEVAP